VGLMGLCEGYVGNWSVEKDLGREGTAGPLAVNSALRRLFFLSRGVTGVRRGSVASCDGTLASASSGMLSTVV
jgi:hypothetical protein